MAQITTFPSNAVYVGSTQVFDASGNLKAPLAATAASTITLASASTSGSTSVEPLAVATTMTGAGGVGGRARFQLNANAALGSWSNALKGITVYGAAGKTTGLGSAVCAELQLSAGTVDGSYAPMELELVMGTGAATGTVTSLIHASVSGAGIGAFDDNGVFFNLQGVTIGAGHIVQEAAVSGVDSTHALKVKIGSTLYYIPLHTSASFA